MAKPRRWSAPFAALLTGIGYATAALPAYGQLQPFELDVKQSTLFGRSDATFLYGGISDSITGALLKTVQQRTAERFAPKYKFLKPMHAPALSAEIAVAAPRMVPELAARAIGPIEMPAALRKFPLAIQERVPYSATPISLNPLIPKLADIQLRDNTQTAPELRPRNQTPLAALENNFAPSIGELRPIAPKPVADLQAPTRSASADISMPAHLTPLESLDTKTRRISHAETTLISTAPAASLPPLAPTRATPVPQIAKASTAANLALAPTGTTSVLAMKTRGEMLPQLETKASPIPPAQPAAKLPDIVIAKPARAPKVKPTPLEKRRAVQPIRSYNTTDTQVALIEPRRQAKRPSTGCSPVTAPIQQSVPSIPPVSQKILWDRWYEHVGKLFDARLSAELERRGNPAGSCTVRITIRRNHQIGIIAIAGTGGEFSAATLSAYRSLDMNPALQFPAGSKRNEVSFVVKNSQCDAGPIVDIDAERIKGDFETQDGQQ